MLLLRGSVAGVVARNASEEARRVSGLMVLFLGPYVFSLLVSSAPWRVFETGNLPSESSLAVLLFLC